jgi:hypothetical protein
MFTHTDRKRRSDLRLRGARRGPLAVTLLLACAACSSASEGTILVNAYGEEFIEDGISAEQMSDGWAIDFAKFEVTIENFTIARSTVVTKKTIDLTTRSRGKGQELGTTLALVGEYEDASFDVVRIAVDGTATLGDAKKSFSWQFDQKTHYDECEVTTQVSENQESSFQVTIHADHLFFDSLVSDDPRMLFGPLAEADQDGDGEITSAELESRDIGSYDPGSEGGVNDLWTWLGALVRTVGHVNGEGHCEATPRT